MTYTQTVTAVILIPAGREKYIKSEENSFSGNYRRTITITYMEDPHVARAIFCMKNQKQVGWPPVMEEINQSSTA